MATFFKILDDPELGQVLIEFGTVRSNDCVSYGMLQPQLGTLCLRLTVRVDVVTDVSMLVLNLPIPEMLNGHRIMQEMDYTEYEVRFRTALMELCEAEDKVQGRGRVNWN